MSPGSGRRVLRNSQGGGAPTRTPERREMTARDHMDEDIDMAVEVSRLEECARIIDELVSSSEVSSG